MKQDSTGPKMKSSTQKKRRRRKKSQKITKQKDNSLEKIQKWAAAGLLTGLMGLSSWTLSTIMDVRDLARENKISIATMNEHTISAIKEDLEAMKKEINKGKKTNELQVRLFEIIQNLETKVNRIR